MYKNSTLFQNLLKLRHLMVAGLFVSSAMAQGQVSPKRAPASYIPDDDVIAKPVDNELSFYQQYVASDKSEDVIHTRNQIRIWNDNQMFAEQYGLDSTLMGSTFFVPTPEEKFEYFKDKYMRYLRSKGEQPLRELPKSWYNDFRASNEVDTIDEMEEHFRKTNRKSVTGKTLPDALKQKEVSIWKDTRFIFQPRVEQGLVVVGIKGPIAYARAWVGVNGRTEVNVQKTMDSIGMRVMFNYYAHNGRYFTSVDQKITGNLYARATSYRNPDAVDDNPKQDNTIMLLYAKQF